jgi:hypothetical protein
MMNYHEFDSLSIHDRGEFQQNLPRSVLDRATAAKLQLENNYQASLQQAIQRNQR